MKFTYLSQDDMIQAGVNDMGRCIEVMEEALSLLQIGDYRMGGDNSNSHGLSIYFPQETDIEGMPTNKPDYRFTAMPAYLGGRFHVAGFKTYGSNIENEAQGMPRSILMVSLLDANSGAPLCYMSANMLSSMRTGAVCGLGAKYLAKKTVEVVAIIGPGNMAIHSMRAFYEVHPEITSVRIKGRSSSGISRFIEFCRENFPGIREYIVCDTYEEACTGADLVYYAATRAEKLKDTSRVEYGWLKKGATLIAASPMFADDALYRSPDVRPYIDNFAMFECSAAGHEYPAQKTVWASLGMGIYDAVSVGWIKRENVINIGDVVLGKDAGRRDEDEILIYAVGGMAIEDVAWGYECYSRAKMLGIGTELTIW